MGHLVLVELRFDFCLHRLLLLLLAFSRFRQGRSMQCLHVVHVSCYYPSHNYYMLFCLENRLTSKAYNVTQNSACITQVKRRNGDLCCSCLCWATRLIRDQHLVITHSWVTRQIFWGNLFRSRQHAKHPAITQSFVWSVISNPSAPETIVFD